jgi:hypothetical protein
VIFFSSAYLVAASWTIGAITLSSLTYQSEVIPVLAVPGLDAARVGALVVRARYLDRTQLALESELLDAFGGEVEVLKAPAYLLAGERLGERWPSRLVATAAENRLNISAQASRRCGSQRLPWFAASPVARPASVFLLVSSAPATSAAHFSAQQCLAGTEPSP